MPFREFVAGYAERLGRSKKTLKSEVNKDLRLIRKTRGWTPVILKNGICVHLMMVAR